MIIESEREVIAMYYVYADGVRLPFKFYNIVAALCACLEYGEACVVDATTGEVLAERE